MKFDIAVLNMNVKEKIICRLCLTVAENGFQLIHEITKKMLKVLLLRVNLDVSKEPIICKDCTEILIKCFNFKSACMDTKKLELFSTHDKNTETANNIFVCRFCGNQTTVGRNFDFLHTLKNDVTFTEKLQALIPELDFNGIKNPVICTSCRQDLEYYIKFAENCSNLEDKITEYCQNEGTPTSGQVKLSEVLRFWSNNILKLDNYRMREIKKEENTLEDIGDAHSEVYDGKLIKYEDIDIKDEDDNFDETRSDMNSSTQNSYFTQTKANYEDCMCDTIHHRDVKCDMQSNMLFSETGPIKACQTKNKGTVEKKNRSLNTKNVSKAIRFKCSKCPHETKRRYDLKRHMLIHEDDREVEMYKCSTCTHQTKNKDSLKKHMLTHKDVTEVEMYKCSMCTYETRHKGYLKKHMLIHKNVTELKMYKCSMCTRETKHKRSLRKHMLIHEDIIKVEIYKCSMCTHETKNKSSLKKHMLTHKGVTEVVMHKCSMCAFATKHKGYLKIHMLTHKDISELVMYKCSMCMHETKHKTSLRKHMLIHKDVTEVEMHKCSMCTYETKLKSDLKRHIKRHGAVEAPQRRRIE